MTQPKYRLRVYDSSNPEQRKRTTVGFSKDMRTDGGEDEVIAYLEGRGHIVTRIAPFIGSRSCDHVEVVPPLIDSDLQDMASSFYGVQVFDHRGSSDYENAEPIKPAQVQVAA